MIGLKEILDILGEDGNNLDATKKEELRVFLEEVLEASKEGETSENIVSAFREKLKNELKADQALKDQVKADLKADQALKDEVKAALKTELTEEVKAEAKNELKTEDLKKEAKNELKTELTEEVKAELKTEAKNELKAELKTEAKNELSNEIKQKVNKLEQIEKEKIESQTKLTKAEQDKAALKEANTHQLQQLDAKIQELEALKAQNNTKEVADLKQLLTDKETEITALKAQPDAAVKKLEGEKTTLTNKIKDLEAQLNNQPNAAQLKDKDEEVNKLNAQVQQLTQKNKELEAKKQPTEQPKQSNAALYTATVGMGLAAGLIAFTALERTVRLDIWVMVGIAVVSTLVAGGITYAALPSTQVNGAKAQEVNENGKGK